jgi:hypothetical protein
MEQEFEWEDLSDCVEEEDLEAHDGQSDEELVLGGLWA